MTAVKFPARTHPPKGGTARNITVIARNPSDSKPEWVLEIMGNFFHDGVVVSTWESRDEWWVTFDDFDAARVVVGWALVSVPTLTGRELRRFPIVACCDGLAIAGLAGHGNWRVFKPRSEGE